MTDGEQRKKALAKFETMGDPLRMAIFTALVRKPASAAELAAEFDTPIGRVRYQLGRLREAGLVELREQRPRRGVVEQVYTSRPAVISIEEFAELTPEEVRRGHVELLKTMFRDCLEALQDGTFFSHEDFMAARMPLRLDEEGWKQASALQHETLDRLLQIHADAHARTESTAGQTIDALAFLFLFEGASRNG